MIERALKNAMKCAGRNANDRRHFMRTSLLLALLGLAVVAQTLPSTAQSPYDYPWCALRGDRSGATSCYYRSYEQCRASLRGIGGSCIRNPYQTRGPRSVREPYRY